MKYSFTALILALCTSLTLAQELTERSSSQNTYRVIISSDFPPLDATIVAIA